MLSSPKIETKPKVEEAEEYDDEEDDVEDADDDDYYAQPENIQGASSKATTEIPAEVSTEYATQRSRNENSSIKIFTQKSPTQKQVAAISSTDRNIRLVQTQNGHTFKYPPEDEDDDEYSTVRNDIPEESEMSKKSDSGSSKTTQKIKYRTRNLPSKSSDTKNNIESDDKNKKKMKPDSFVSVTNSLSGRLDENNQENGKFASTYYTKSSTCGFMTFSCNIVYGSNGRSRICRPKQENQKC